mmetsp:Transcript_24954/g.63577  ORF Transcript_24954/g.63577 Transcript_24954/m.63577 type:complete len:204 (+) Transcript_24954:830-1441(+)
MVNLAEGSQPPVVPKHDKHLALAQAFPNAPLSRLELCRGVLHRAENGTNELHELRHRVVVQELLFRLNLIGLRLVRGFVLGLRLGFRLVSLVEVAVVAAAVAAAAAPQRGGHSLRKADPRTACLGGSGSGGKNLCRRRLLGRLSLGRLRKRRSGGRRARRSSSRLGCGRGRGRRGGAARDVGPGALRRLGLLLLRLRCRGHGK